MILVEKALAKKRLEVDGLPISLQKKVSELDSMCKAFKEAWEQYEEHGETDEATEERFDRIEADIQNRDNNLFDKIMSFTPEPEIPPAPPAPEKAPETPPAPEKAPEAPKKKSGGGWVLFFGITAAALLAAVGIKNAKK